jgi:hypothetical protein
MNSYVKPAMAGRLQSGNYQIRAGCYSNLACSGTVVYAVTDSLQGGPHGSYAYSATNTNAALQNTVNQSVTIADGDTIKVGTCTVTGASGSHDTYLRFYDPAGAQVAFSDDGANCGGLSYFSYKVPAGSGGTYQIRAGCGGSFGCSGTVAWEVIGGTPLPPPPPPTVGSFPYSATNTNSATQNTTNVDVPAAAGQTIAVGTCTLPGASGTGDTYLRLYDATGSQVAYNDDRCGLLSSLTYVVPAGKAGTYQVRAGCYSSGTCGGTVAYTVQ